MTKVREKSFKNKEIVALLKVQEGLRKDLWKIDDHWYEKCFSQIVAEEIYGEMLYDTEQVKRDWEQQQQVVKKRREVNSSMGQQENIFHCKEVLQIKQKGKNEDEGRIDKIHGIKFQRILRIRGEQRKNRIRQIHFKKGGKLGYLAVYL